jgi:hypothetical protein
VEAAEAVLCHASAVIGVAAFVPVAAYFRVSNGGGIKLTEQQKFFVRAVHGQLDAGTDPVHFIFNANFFPGFREVGRRAVTFVREVFLIDEEVRVDNPGKQFIELDFADQITLLIHEMTHVSQYGDRENSIVGSLVSFLYDYGFAFCKAGFDNDKNVFESEPTQQIEPLVQPLFDPFPEFFKLWQLEVLVDTLGFPATYALISSTDSVNNETVATQELFFEHGSIEIAQSKPEQCFRVWPPSFGLLRRNFVNCQFSPASDCPDIIRDFNAATKPSWTCNLPIPPVAKVSCVPITPPPTTSTIRPRMCVNFPPICDDVFVSNHNAKC